MRFRRKAAGVVEARSGEGVAESAGGLRAGGGGGGRSVQVHGHESVHAGADAARPALRVVRDAADGDCGCAGGAGARAAVRVLAGGRGEHPGESGGWRRWRRRRSIACWTRSTGQRAVHLCFGNYGGQTIQKGEWRALIDFLNALHVDHLVLEMAHRPASDLEALREIDPRIKLGIGVVDVKVNHVETAEEIARRIECAEKAAGPGRVGWVHPDCGFWMLKRSVADRKIAALVKGRDLYLGRS